MATPSAAPAVPGDRSHPADTFDARKARILAGIASPGPDASPKGSIDTHVIPLINRLNSHADVVTTSSCSGRISVFLEGAKKLRTPDASNSNNTGEQGSELNTHDDCDDDNHVDHGEANGQLQTIDPALAAVAPGEKSSSRPNAGVGGKGDGGRWLFVSHDPLDITQPISDADIADMVMERNSGEIFECLGFKPSVTTRFVHFKFEPMILHIQTRNLEVAQTILSTALSTGFRESGIMNMALGKNQCPMVAIRSNGLVMDSIIGLVDENGIVQKCVDDSYIAMLARVGNMRFTENFLKIEKLTKNLEDALFTVKSEVANDWEDKEVRKARKRAEGLKRQEEARLFAAAQSTDAEVIDGMGLVSLE
ncbi:methyltransferase TYW3-domain-containing protein [Pyronema domesticum]|uniref:tRNA(Phe) 7-[(3-amino-3-carboxypropyl)-4-demethylwyosine(37)-N(4)]-methyltransferase n=1 Tax=Pyronema omphalodes (strain CBS 100304) TaxID=1076935 RepID=U4L5U1_PYROM|nr:methyltransferase TYW3-domain-containing protein [Pyronema domesticum]CCX07796.1 Similar to tRNA wybutosine-synthesizing protein 3; acc. no. Q9UTA5 [Pyronema omphalodes CBS 100304]